MTVTNNASIYLIFLLSSLQYRAKRGTGVVAGSFPGNVQLVPLLLNNERYGGKTIPGALEDSHD